MTQATHTPGPWKVHERKGRAGHNHPFCIASDHFNKDGMISGEGQVAEIASGPNFAEANARLVAAAPDLLEAAMALDSMFDNDGPLLTVYKKEIEQFRAAIAKAIGDA